MLNLIPSVKILKETNGFLKNTSVFYSHESLDKRIVKALEKLNFDKEGVPLYISTAGNTGEGYELYIREDRIDITADSPAGAFYAIQTLRQIFSHDTVPCLYIKDEPDFKYRGFYHDVTRGKVPTTDTLKKLIDEMAYYKLNSLQLYVEHTFEFEEYKDIIGASGFLTKQELAELDSYCEENFIEFIPSLSTFGHLFELLDQPKYSHLRVLKDHDPTPNRWYERMAHYTIDPLNSESIDIIKSLIDQYIPCFKSDFFNICCDETFDLNKYEKSGYNPGELYVSFVNQIIDHVRQNNKKVMMWADILLKHPETIASLPEDTCFLNWSYSANPSEASAEQLFNLGRQQIVCPGTHTWSRLCENITTSEKNISKMASYGRKYGALGILNTNWGDWGNPCSIELAMYGLVLGAEKSWSEETPVDDAFRSRVDFLLYGNTNGTSLLRELSDIHSYISWNSFANEYFKHRFGTENTRPAALSCTAETIQKLYREFSEKLSAAEFANNEFKEEMQISAYGLCLLAELYEKLSGQEPERLTSAAEFIKMFSEKWNSKNKPSELCKIADMFTYCENV